MQIRCDNKNNGSNNKFGGCDIRKQEGCSINNSSDKGRKEQDNQEKIVVRIKVYAFGISGYGFKRTLLHPNSLIH